MTGAENAGRLDRLIDCTSAAVLAAAVGMSTGLLLEMAPLAGRIAAGLAAGAVAFGAVKVALRSLAGANEFSLPGFEPPELTECLAAPWPGELLLGEADRIGPECRQAATFDGDGELMLDDILSSVAADSRVYQLFEPGNPQTPGELSVRIDRHLELVSVPPADAAEEMYAALAALRESMR